jgi:4-hydroxy-tetrahydrodipicolinate reductase
VTTSIEAGAVPADSLRQPLRCAIWGTGKMGVELTRALTRRADLTPVAAIVTDPVKDGRDLGEICGLGPLGVIASTDTDDVLRRSDVDVVWLCGVGDTLTVTANMRRCSLAGKDAITFSGLLHAATALGPAGARELDQVARANGTRMLGTGFVGFFTDALAVSLATLTVDWSSITVSAVMPMDDWSQAMLDAYGVGRTPEDFDPGIRRISLLESVGMIADALGVALERCDVALEPIVASRRISGSRTVEAGLTHGVRKTYTGTTTAGRPIVVDVAFVYDLAASDEWDEQYVIEIEPISEGGGIRAELTGGWSPDPYPATAAAGINAVWGLRSLPPGLYSMTQVPMAVQRDDWPAAIAR